MKQKSLRKAATVLLLSISLGSFLYVNTDIRLSGNRNLYQNAQTEAEVNSEESPAITELPVPAVSVLSRLFELAQRFNHR